MVRLNNSFKYYFSREKYCKALQTHTGTETTTQENYTRNSTPLSEQKVDIDIAKTEHSICKTANR